MRVTPLPGTEGKVKVVLEKLGETDPKPVEKTVDKSSDGPVQVPLGDLAPGGYSAKVTVGASPPARHDFACEKGGEAWADSRPDPERLKQIAEATGGKSVTADEVAGLPLPESTRIAAERHVTPVLPPWVWTLLAALALGAHWFTRRRGGLA